jgi:hypothetical protein
MLKISSSSSSSSSSCSSSSSSWNDEPVPLNAAQLSALIDLSESVVDRGDIGLGDPPVNEFVDRHIQRLLSIRSEIKAPKSAITKILAYIHEEFKEVDGVKDLPRTWQQCESKIKHVKPKFIKVYACSTYMCPCVHYCTIRFGSTVVCSCRSMRV